MDHSSYQVRLDNWASLIQEQISSGLTKSEWCRINGITERQFFYWQRKIRNLITDPCESSSLVPSKAQLPSAPEFVELPIPSPNHTSDSAPGRSCDLILEVNGCRLLIGDSVSRKTLSTVIEVLRHV